MDFLRPIACVVCVCLWQTFSGFAVQHIFETSLGDCSIRVFISNRTVCNVCSIRVFVKHFGYEIPNEISIVRNNPFTDCAYKRAAKFTLYATILLYKTSGYQNYHNAIWITVENGSFLVA